MNLEFQVYGWLAIHPLLQHQGLEEGGLEEICVRGEDAPPLGALAGQRPVDPPELVLLLHHPSGAVPQQAAPFSSLCLLFSFALLPIAPLQKAPGP